MIQFFARVVELREGKIAFASESVKYDGKVTTDSPSREFLEVTSNLTNSGLLTIEKHYTLTGSSVFLYFKVSKARNIDAANTEMHHKSKKALVNQGLLANF